MAKGKWALGIFELFASLVIAALAVGAFANPVEKVAGDSGLIMQTRDVGLDLAAGMANNGNVEGDADAMRQTVTATMVDTFIRADLALVLPGIAVANASSRMSSRLAPSAILSLNSTVLALSSSSVSAEYSSSSAMT